MELSVRKAQHCTLVDNLCSDRAFLEYTKYFVHYTVATIPDFPIFHIATSQVDDDKVGDVNSIYNARYEYWDKILGQ